MKLKVYTFDGSQCVEKEFDGIEIFEGNKGVQAVKDVVVAYRANARQGTRSTKTRGEVRGGGKKPWKQKGTGRARVGSSRSPLWRHGGTVFGPQPHGYDLKVNVKAKKNALRSVLSERIAGGQLHVLESLDIDTPRTKEFIGRLAKLGFQGEKVLFVDSFENLNLMLATRNRRELATADALHVHVYQVLNAKQVVFSRRALQQLAEVLSP
jgi:large subunit ribosomal protein L4